MRHRAANLFCMRLTFRLAFATALAFLAFDGSAMAGDYSVKTSEMKVQANTRGVSPVVITASGGWHLNEQAPLWLKLSAPEGLTLGKAKLERPDLTENTKDRARFDVAVTASGSPGKRTLDGEAFFVLCQEQACRPITTKISVPVEVVAAAAPPAAKPAAASVTAHPKKKPRRK